MPCSHQVEQSGSKRYCGPLLDVLLDVTRYVDCECAPHDTLILTLCISPAYLGRYCVLRTLYPLHTPVGANWFDIFDANLISYFILDSESGASFEPLISIHALQFKSIIVLVAPAVAECPSVIHAA